MEKIISIKRASGRFRTAETYRSALNSLLQFTGGKDIGLSEIGPELLLGYEWFMKSRGLTRNTTSFYMRILRAAYNRCRSLKSAF